MGGSAAGAGCWTGVAVRACMRARRGSSDMMRRTRVLLHASKPSHRTRWPICWRVKVSMRPATGDGMARQFRVSFRWFVAYE